MELLEQVREHIVGARPQDPTAAQLLTSSGTNSVGRPSGRLTLDDLEALMDRVLARGEHAGYQAGVADATERARSWVEEMTRRAETRGAIGAVRAMIDHVRPARHELATSEEFDTRRALVETLEVLLLSLTGEGVSGERPGRPMACGDREAGEAMA